MTMVTVSIPNQEWISLSKLKQEGAILALGVARDAHEESWPRLPCSTLVMITLRNMSTMGTSICEWPTSSNKISLLWMKSHK